MSIPLDGALQKRQVPSSQFLTPEYAAVTAELDDEIDQLRVQQRARERLSRQRRLEKLKQLRADVKTMEQLVVALPLVDDVDQAWDAFLDDDVKRVRKLLRRLVPTTDAIKDLTQQNKQLEALVAEHKLAMRAVKSILDKAKLETEADDWALNLQRWKALARIHFTPWTTERLAEELDAALLETHEFAYSTNKQSTGLSFMGWEDSLRLLRDATALQFSFFKTFRSHNVEQHAAFVKRAFTETDLYHRVMLGSRGLGSVDVLQQITPNAAIVMYHAQYEGANYTVHSMDLVADVKTEDGIVQYMRSIDAPEVMRAFVGPSGVWISKFYWMQHDLLDLRQPKSSCDYRVSLRGTLQGKNSAFLRMWLFELLCTLIRAETVLSGNSLLTWS